MILKNKQPVGTALPKLLNKPQLFISKINYDSN